MHSKAKQAKSAIQKQKHIDETRIYRNIYLYICIRIFTYACIYDYIFWFCFVFFFVSHAYIHIYCSKYDYYLMYVCIVWIAIYEISLLILCTCLFFKATRNTTHTHTNILIL